jgi:hypothetical protein
VLSQQLADAGRLLSAVREEAAELAAELSAAQASLAAQDALVRQLKAAVGGGGMCASAPSGGAATATGAPADGAAAGAASAREGGDSISSSPLTHSPSRVLSRQSSSRGVGVGSQHAVSQVCACVASRARLTVWQAACLPFQPLCSLQACAPTVHTRTALRAGRVDVEGRWAAEGPAH